MNTDGVTVFKSSKVSIRPLYLIINELPYGKQLATENMIFAGLWFGENKPAMWTFLNPHIHSFAPSLKRVLKWNRLKEENFTAKAFCSLALVIFQRETCFATVCNTMAKMAAGNVYSLEKLCEPVFAVTVGHFSTRMIIPKDC